MEQLLVGRKFKLERRITPEVTADRYGNKGVEVFNIKGRPQIRSATLIWR